MTYFYQIENSDHINRVYGPPYPSGAETIPYTFGWANKYAPKPFGLKTLASNYTFLANSNFNGAANQLPAYGPINEIYEVEFSGFRNIPGPGCSDCDYLNNTKFYIYLLPENRMQDSINKFPTTTPETSIWRGTTCSVDRPINLCNTSNLRLQLESVGTNSGVHLTLRLYHNSQSGVYTFSKNFGSINFLSSNSGEIAKKPNMLTEHILIGSGGPPFLNSADGIHASLNDYACDVSGAIATLRPYKSNFYDVKNTLLPFHSGDYAMIGSSFNWNPSENNELITQLGLNNFCKSILEYKSDSFRITNFSASGISVLTSDMISFGYYPGRFKLSFDNVVEKSGTLSHCISCSGFYKAGKTLVPSASLLMSFTDSEVVYYLWTTHADLNPSFTSAREPGPSFNPNYYNICNHGCGSDKNQGACNNIVQLKIVSSGNSSTLNSGLFVDAFLDFFSTADGITYTHARNRFHKKLCDNRTVDNKCHDGAFDPIFIQGGIGSGLGHYGLVDCLNNHFWSSGWNYIPVGSSTMMINSFSTLETATSLIDQKQDITEYCDFSNSRIALEPNRLGATHCMSTAGTICTDGLYIPQSVNFDITMSAGIPFSIGSKSFILTRQREIALSSYSIFRNGKEAKYQYIDDDDKIYLEFIGNSGIVRAFAFCQFSVPSGTFEGTIDLSRPNLGGALNYYIDCNTPFTGTGLFNTIGPVAPGTLNNPSVTITPADLYNINDYL